MTRRWWVEHVEGHGGKWVSMRDGRTGSELEMRVEKLQDNMFEIVAIVPPTHPSGLWTIVSRTRE